MADWVSTAAGAHVVYLTPQAAAVRLGVSPRTVLRRVDHWALPALEITPGLRRVPSSALELWAPGADPLAQPFGTTVLAAVWGLHPQTVRRLAPHLPFLRRAPVSWAGDPSRYRDWLRAHLRDLS